MKSPMTESKAQYTVTGRNNNIYGSSLSQSNMAQMGQNRVRESLSGDPIMRNPRGGMAITSSTAMKPTGASGIQSL